MSTQEKWEVQSKYFSSITNYGLDSEKDVIVVGGKMGDIALINNTYTPEDQDKIAALIASAPELLAACKAFKKALEDGVLKTNDLGTEMMVGDAIEKAKDAIAKAEPA